MRSPRVSLLLVVLFVPASVWAQQALVCPPAASSSSARACDSFHYHVQMYRPDTKQFVELYGLNRFATEDSCNRALEAQRTADQAVVEFFHANKQQQYEADRFGPCHCDATLDRNSPLYLTAEQRELQLRTEQEIRLRVRERLIDAGVATDAELLRRYSARPGVAPLAGAAKIVAVPEASKARPVTTPDELLVTSLSDSGRQSVPAAMDLPLVDAGEAPVQTAVGQPPQQPSAATVETVTVAAPTPASAPEPAAAPTATPAAASASTTTESVAPAAASNGSDGATAAAETAPVEQTPSPADVQSAQDVAERFISYETQRIQSVLKASAGIADETVKSKIFDACMQRIQLLSNLRLLIEGSGIRSPLAAAARAAESESDRLALVARLFGSDMPAHWAPKDAMDVVVETDATAAVSPEAVLRDTTGKVTREQKKRALYQVLAQTQPAEDQRLWLSSVVEELLK